MSADLGFDIDTIDLKEQDCQSSLKPAFCFITTNSPSKTSSLIVIQQFYNSLRAPLLK